MYKTTNTNNNKIYIGVHSTPNLEDGYLGSGKLLLKAISKYGKDIFKREILAFYETSIDAYNAERLLVDEDFVKRTDTYNLTCGGNGGSLAGELHPWYNRKHTADTIAKMKIAQAGDKHHTRKYGISNEQKQKLSIINSGSGNPMYGKSHPSKGKHIHTDETKALISSIHKGKTVSKQSIEKQRKSLKEYYKNNKAKTCQKISCNGIIFDSCKKCSRIF